MCDTTTIEEVPAIFSSARFVSRGNQQQHHALLLHQLKNREMCKLTNDHDERLHRFEQIECRKID